MPTPPYDHLLNLTTQAILTYASWTIALALLGVSVWRGYQKKTVFPVLIVLAAAVAALAEPLYDIGYKLLFFVPGQWTLFTYGEIPQPVWTISGYMILYAGPALFVCEALAAGISRRNFLTWAAGTLLASSVFEIYGIAGGAYSYWGAHALRVFGYPLAVGVLETTFVMVFSVLAHEYRNRATNSWALLGLFALFPATFYAVNFGIGAPTLVTLGLASPSPVLSTMGAIVSIGIALGVLTALASFVSVPQRNTRQQPLRASSRESDAHAH